MDNWVTDLVIDHWFSYLVEYKRNNYEILDSHPSSNPLINDKNFLIDAKEIVGYDVRKAFGMPYVKYLTSDKFELYYALPAGYTLEMAFFIETYIENKEFIIAKLKEYSGVPTEDPTSSDKKAFLKGLEELLTRINPDFITNLESYLANSEFLLNDLKKYLGVPDEDTTFDSELSILCKSGYARLFDMVSNDRIYSTGVQNNLYTIIFEGGLPYLGNIIEVGKEWLYLYVKLSFDPPTASTLTYLKERLNELEWYIVNYNLGDWIYGEQKHADSKTPWD